MTPEELSKLTPEEKRIKIAEITGWTNVRHTTVIKSRVMRRGIFGNSPDGIGGNTLIPDFLNDLNAMHEAENILDVDPDIHTSLRYAYAGNLYGITVPKDGQPFRATALQRADAFLLTKG